MLNFFKKKIIPISLVVAMMAGTVTTSIADDSNIQPETNENVSNIQVENLINNDINSDFVSESIQSDENTIQNDDNHVHSLVYEINDDGKTHTLKCIDCDYSKDEVCDVSEEICVCGRCNIAVVDTPNAGIQDNNPSIEIIDSLVLESKQITQTVDNIEITLFGNMPKDSEVIINPVSKDDIDSNYDDEYNTLFAYDIRIMYGENHDKEYEPEAYGETIAVTFSDLSDTVYAETVAVIHDVSDGESEILAEIVNEDDNNVNEITVLAESFSIYRIASIKATASMTNEGLVNVPLVNKKGYIYHMQLTMMNSNESEDAFCIDLGKKARTGDTYYKLLPGGYTDLSESVLTNIKHVIQAYQSGTDGLSYKAAQCLIWGYQDGVITSDSDIETVLITCGVSPDKVQAIIDTLKVDIDENLVLTVWENFNGSPSEAGYQRFITWIGGNIISENISVSDYDDKALYVKIFAPNGESTVDDASVAYYSDALHVYKYAKNASNGVYVFENFYDGDVANDWKLCINQNALATDLSYVYYGYETSNEGADKSLVFNSEKYLNSTSVSELNPENKENVVANVCRNSDLSSQAVDGYTSIANKCVSTHIAILKPVHNLYNNDGSLATTYYGKQLSEIYKGLSTTKNTTDKLPVYKDIPVTSTLYFYKTFDVSNSKQVGTAVFNKSLRKAGLASAPNMTTADVLTKWALDTYTIDSLEDVKSEYNWYLVGSIAKTNALYIKVFDTEGFVVDGAPLSIKAIVEGNDTPFNLTASFVGNGVYEISEFYSNSYATVESTSVEIYLNGKRVETFNPVTVLNEQKNKNFFTSLLLTDYNNGTKYDDATFGEIMVQTDLVNPSEELIKFRLFEAKHPLISSQVTLHSLNGSTHSDPTSTTVTAMPSFITKEGVYAFNMSDVEAQMQGNDPANGSYEQHYDLALSTHRFSTEPFYYVTDSRFADVEHFDYKNSPYADDFFNRVSNTAFSQVTDMYFTSDHYLYFTTGEGSSAVKYTTNPAAGSDFTIVSDVCFVAHYSPVEVYTKDDVYVGKLHNVCNADTDFIVSNIDVLGGDSSGAISYDVPSTVYYPDDSKHYSLDNLINPTTHEESQISPAKYIGYAAGSSKDDKYCIPFDTISYSSFTNYTDEYTGVNMSDRFPSKCVYATVPEYWGGPIKIYLVERNIYPTITLDENGGIWNGEKIDKLYTYQGKVYYDQAHTDEFDYKTAKLKNLPSKDGSMFVGFGKPDITAHSRSCQHTIRKDGSADDTNFSSVISGDKSVTLYAHYDAVYKVTLDDNGGTGGDRTFYVSADKNGVFGWTYKNKECSIEIVGATIPTKSGYKFLGYYIDADVDPTSMPNINSSSTSCYIDEIGYIVKGEYTPLSKITSDITLYAIWEESKEVPIEITLDDNGGSGGNEQYYVFEGATFSDAEHTAAISKVTVPTYDEEHAFKGYFSAKTGGTKVIDTDGTILSNGKTFTSNTTVYAQWEESKVYTVTLNDNFTSADVKGSEGIGKYYVRGNFAYETNSRDDDISIAAVEVPTWKNDMYKFKGYYLGETLIVDELGNIQSAGVNITEDIEATAKWEKNMFRVIFMEKDAKGDDSEYSNDYVSADEYIPCPIDTDINVPDGTAEYEYVFTGKWRSSIDNKEYTHDDISATKPTADVTYTAIYAKNELYTVKYTDYDGTVLDEFAEITINSSVPAYHGIDPERNATADYQYKFKGWSYGGTIYTSNDEITALKVTSSMIFVAVYEEVPFKLIIDWNHPSKDMDNYQLLYMNRTWYLPANSSDINDDATYTVGEQFKEFPSAPDTVEGLTFDGIFETKADVANGKHAVGDPIFDAKLQDVCNFLKSGISEDTTLYGCWDDPSKWPTMNTVKFVLNDESCPDINKDADLYYEYVVDATGECVQDTSQKSLTLYYNSASALYYTQPTWLVNPHYDENPYAVMDISVAASKDNEVFKGFYTGINGTGECYVNDVDSMFTKNTNDLTGDIVLYAYLSPATDNDNYIVFKNGDEIIDDGYYANNTKIIVPPSPKKEEDVIATYVFDGWTDENGTTYKPSAIPDATEDMVYTASFTSTKKKYNARYYTIHYSDEEKQNGSYICHDGDSVTYSLDSSVSATEGEYGDAIEFVGSNEPADTVIYSHSYKWTFTGWSGMTLYDSQVSLWGSNVPFSPLSTYRLLTDEECGLILDAGRDANNTFKEEHVVNVGAVYTKEPIKYHVVYKNTDDTVIAEQTCYYFSNVLLRPSVIPVDPSGENRAFKTWLPEANSTDEADAIIDGAYKKWVDAGGDISKPVELEFVASYSDNKQTGTVTFVDANGDILLAEKTYTIGDTISTPMTPVSHPTLPNMVFDKWSPDLNLTFQGTVVYTATYKPAHSYDACAITTNIYVDNIKTAYHTIYQYNAVPGTTISVSDIKEGVAENIYANKQHISDWLNKGYALKEITDAATGATVSSDYVVPDKASNEINIYLVSPTPTYTITFKDWNGVVISSVLYAANDDISVPKDPSRDGYNFVGWSPALSNKAVADATYVAQYEELTIDKIYVNVRFVDYDDRVISNKDYEKGTSISIPVNPSRSGYTFKGWSPAVSPVAYSNVIYKAMYEKNEQKREEPIKPMPTQPTTPTVTKYTITFKNYDGTVISQRQYTAGATVTVPANPVRVDDGQYKYTFKAWSPSVSSIVTGNATYTATYNTTKISNTVPAVPSVPESKPTPEVVDKPVKPDGETSDVPTLKEDIADDVVTPIDDANAEPEAPVLPTKIKRRKPQIFTKDLSDNSTKVTITDVEDLPKTPEEIKQEEKTKNVVRAVTGTLATGVATVGVVATGTFNYLYLLLLCLLFKKRKIKFSGLLVENETPFVKLGGKPDDDTELVLVQDIIDELHSNIPDIVERLQGEKAARFTLLPPKTQMDISYTDEDGELDIQTYDADEEFLYQELEKCKDVGEVTVRLYYKNVFSIELYYDL